MLEHESKGLAAPIGQHITIPSALTGRLLTYFIPYPINELSSRLTISPERNPAQLESSEAAWLLASYLSHGFSHSFLPKTYSEVLLGRRELRSTDDLLRLASAITPKAVCLRQQMAFAGGPTPSTATIIYCPASAVPALLDSLSLFLSSDLSKWKPVDVAALVGYFAIHIHPFADGNGRWARLLSAHAGMCAGSLWDGMATAVFQKSCKSRLISLWSSARNHGLLTYFEETRRFSTKLMESCAESGYVHATIQINKKIREHAHDQKTAHQIISYLFIERHLAESTVKQLLGCSHRKANGFINELVEGQEELICLEGSGVSIEKLLASVTRIIESSSTDDVKN